MEKGAASLKSHRPQIIEKTERQRVTMNQNKLGLIFVLASSFCYALTGILSKVLVSSGLPPMLTLTLRTLFCTVFFRNFSICGQKRTMFSEKEGY